MKPNRKTILLLLLNISFILSFRQSFAQYPGMRAVYSNMNRQLMNQQMNMQMSQNALRMNLNVQSDLVNLAYDYLVILKDSTKKEVNSKIYSDTSLHKNYLFLGDPDSKSDSKNKTLRIYSDQTLSICRTVTQENSSRIINIIGMANDSCWMFKVVSGAINAYSFLSEQDTDFNPLTINGIQVGNGLIENYNNENLKKLISSDAEAVKYFEKKKYYKAMVTYNNDVEKANNK